jgi:DMSO/TMAO reductase YedYZ heme-binding membrane subunit
VSSTSLWYIARSSGIVATVLAVLALMWGLLFSSRETGSRLRPAWWLDLHNWLGGLTLAFTIVHVVAIFADSDAGIGLAQVFVPGAAKFGTTAITWGVLAMYVFAVVTFTSWGRVKRRMSRRVWHWIHLTSVFAVIVAGLHAYQIGTDRDSLAFRAGLVVLAGASMYPAALRVFSLGDRRAAAPQRGTTGRR